MRSVSSPGIAIAIQIPRTDELHSGVENDAVIPNNFNALIEISYFFYGATHLRHDAVHMRCFKPDHLFAQ